MTVEEKRKALAKHCERLTDCRTCPIEDDSATGKGCYTAVSDELVEKHYEMVFGPDCEAKDTSEPEESDRPKNLQVMTCEEHKEKTFPTVREIFGPAIPMSEIKPPKADPIKPEYYNDTKFSPFDVIDDWGLNFYLGNAVKYIKRAGKKEGNSRLQDLKKIREYIDHEIRAEESKA